MAKINIARRSLPNFYKVFVRVYDPNCVWNIKIYSNFYRVLKATSIKNAVKAAKDYCKKWSNEFKTVEFSFDKNLIEPYFYHENYFKKEED